MMNIEQGMSNDEVGRLGLPFAVSFDIQNSLFDIRYWSLSSTINH